MRKALVEVDELLLREAASVLGTATREEAVHAALKGAIDRSLRRGHLERLTHGGLPGLADPEVTSAAWE